MKVHGKRSNPDRSCSCTSCVYNSGSGDLSLQKLLISGSKIDRLYYGKYIPLREKKLLEKLVRTRAVYDDIRAQLVSDSASSLIKNANFKPKKSGSEIDDTERSSAVLELVNLVDKGAALKSSKISACCSCCSCSSKINLREHTHKIHKHRHGYENKYASEKRRYDFKKRRKGVHFRAKHIRSDPCTCTFQFSGLDQRSNDNDDIKHNNLNDSTSFKRRIAGGLKQIRESKTKLQEAVTVRASESLENVKKLKDHFKPVKHSPDVAIDNELFLYKEKNKTQRMKDYLSSSRDKLKSSQTRLKNKLQESGEVVELKVKKSLEKVKRGKDNIKNVICKCHESVENILGKDKDKEIALKIRKDSIRKFKDNLNRKKILRDWTCENDCIQGSCEPEECFKKLKLRKSLKQKLISKHERVKALSKVSSHRINVAMTPKKSSTGIQAQKTTIQIATRPKKEIKLKEGFKVKKDKKRVENTLKNPMHSLSSKDKFNSRQAVRIGSSFSFNIEFYKDKPNSILNNDPAETNKKVNKNSLSQRNNKQTLIKRQRKPQVHLRKSKNELKQTGHALKRCFCTFKLIPKRYKSLSQKSIGTMSSLPYNQLKELHPNECEPGICIPYQCDPNECLKFQNKRLNTQTNYRSQHSYTSYRKTKSTSSVTTKSKSSKAKQVQSAIIPRRVYVSKNNRRKAQRLYRRSMITKPNRNVVRIGSTFSFNIDFYKDTGHQQIPRPAFDRRPNVNSFTIQPKLKVKPEKKYKISKEKVKKRKIVKSTTGTETDPSDRNIKTRSKATKTKKYISRLEPYECEPFTCIPGECNPYICLQKIRKRYKDTKEVSINTYNPESISTSSYTYSQISKDVFAQSKPKTKGRKVYAKAKTVKLIEKATNQQPQLPHDKCKNAVSIGSTFSFNVEFSKNQTKKNFIEPLNFSPIPDKVKTKNKFKHKGIKLNKIKNEDADTQIDTKRKSDKSSTVGPMLKRCFCTLNLYKRQKREKMAVYTVNTAMLKTTFPSMVSSTESDRIYNVKNCITEEQNFLGQFQYSDKNNDSLDGKNTISHNSMYLNPLETTKKTNQSLEINSDLSINVELVRKLSKSKIYLKESEIVENISITNYDNYFKSNKSFCLLPTNKDKTGFRRYVNKCFYAMNMQVENKAYTRRKLKPYECEPGICIPGECDPYKCQKLIMKRLQKAKSSGTESGTKSVSSSQTHVTSTQSHSNSAVVQSDKHGKKKIKNIDQNIRRTSNYKKVVRLGSNFSFDVEFYKKRSSNGESFKIHRQQKSRSTIGKSTKGKRSRIYTRERKNFTKYNTKDSQSQSDRPKLIEKTSHTLQNMQRCFCTLKLHKQGKLQRKVKKEIADSSRVETVSVKTADRGQNTKQWKNTYNLLPYECEPGICIPGECDPYECLALINKRKLQERGTETPMSQKTTASNATAYKRKHKSRAVIVKPRRQPGSFTKPPKRRTLSNSSSQDITGQTKQMVRIGSSFSFNIDFYKNALPSDSDKVRRVKAVSRNVVKRNKPQLFETPHPKKSRKMIASPSSFSQVSQTDKQRHMVKSTAVEPFLKRCFCTLQLRNKDKAKRSEKEFKKPEYKSVMTMTKGKKESVAKNDRISYEHDLLPYECEPSFCVPGECDPLVCLERIKKRKAKSLGTEIKPQNRKSIASSVALNKKKHKQIQFQPVDVQKRRVPDKNKTSKIVKNREQKQVVRIGSNFSFNVEFFKDSGAHHNTNIPEKVKVLPKKIKERPISNISKSHKIVQDKNRARSSHSQTQSKSKSVKSGRFIDLKRCFCTLALKNHVKSEAIAKAKESKVKSKKPQEKKIKTKEQHNNFNKSLHKDVQTTKSAVSAVSTFFKKCLCALTINKKKQSQMPPVVNLQIKPQKYRNRLEPYECEPGTCTPGECDPYECEKRIQKRLLREIATETKPLKFHTQSSITRASKARHAKTHPKKSTNKVQLPDRHEKAAPTISLNNESDRKQCVRIGSTFSFNVEFFKHGDAGHQLESSSPHTIRINRTETKDYLSKKHKQQQLARNLGKYHVSQSARVKTKPSSTITDPFLKRCFCTLQLHKSGTSIKNSESARKLPSKNPKPNKVTSTKKTTTVSYMTSQQEYAPFMCLPNPNDNDNKNENIDSQKFQTRHKTVLTKPLSTKSKKIQARVMEKESLVTSVNQNGIVEVPRFNNFLNKDYKQAVRYGSNFSFNIEFYKEVLPSEGHKTHLRGFDKSEAKTIEMERNIPSSKSKITKNNYSHTNKSKVFNKKSNTANKLKRCFCTLKLQKSKSNAKAVYAQSVEVRRVEIHKNIKPSKKTNTESKNVSTKIDNKLIEPNAKQTSAIPKTSDKMQTILPYRPTKFNQKQSKTIVNNSTKVKKQGKKKNNKISITNYRKRLTRKESLKIICTNPLCEAKSIKPKIKQYVCQCDTTEDKTNTDLQASERVPLKVSKRKKIFRNDLKTREFTNDIKSCYSERNPKHIAEVSELKSSKSVKLSKKNKKERNREDLLLVLKTNDHNAGDHQHSPQTPTSMFKKITKDISRSGNSSDNEQYVCPKCRELQNTIKGKKKVNFKEQEEPTNKGAVTVSKVKSKPLNTPTPASQRNTNVKKIEEKTKPKSKSKILCESCANDDQKCKYCKVCFRSESTMKKYFKVIMEKLPFKKWLAKINESRLPKKERVPQPLFDVFLESDSFSIINKEEVNRKVVELHKKSPKIQKKQKKHSESCQCCICLGNKGPKQQMRKRQTEYSRIGQKVGKRKCTCGSEVCAKKVLQMKLDSSPKSVPASKPCECGSPVCKEESLYLQEIARSPHKMSCLCQEEMSKRKHKAKIKSDKEYRKRRKILSKQENIEDRSRRKYRKKEDKRLEKSINKNASDVMLVAESVVDVARFGFTGISDILRALYRCVRDPRHTLFTLKSMKEDPRLIGKSLKNAYDDSGVASTARRIKKRVQSMESVKAATEFLEQYPVSNYLLHVADKDPKKRLRPIRKKRRKERIDFNCNLFMGSLRKRPFLFIYDRCPWFYPHCLTFVNVWRQFADLMLFLLAVVFWSPCIFAMEICRAVMCCAFCTG